MTLIFVSLLFAVASVAYSQFVVIPDMTSGNIYRLNTETGESNLVIGGQQRPVAIAYDELAGIVFWTDITVNAIKWCYLDGSNETVIIRLVPPSTSDGMTVSAPDQRVFYSDTGSNVIGAINYDGSNQQNIITTDLLEPRAIAVDPSIRTMFFTDWGYTPARIWSANMDDGSNRVLIVNSAIVWPNGLTIDTTTQQLFWCDGNNGVIESLNYDGTNRVVVATQAGARWFGIAVDSDSIFVSSWAYTQVSQYPRAGGTRSVLSPQTFGQQGHLAYVPK